MSGEYKYDAFISYRHLSPDKPIAERLQKLLEAYVPPKNNRGGRKAQKLRLFRDETELPTSNDLGGDIKLALEQSRFLVVVCSENFEKSKWCMQEVAYFQELHGGSNRQILTLFVGDPDVPPFFPEPLRYEPKTVLLPDGTETVVREEIEPLAANVSAKTLKRSLKRLKVEFLRIAAPLLGCGFDDLFQREQRRRTRRRITGVTAAAAALALVAVFSTIAVQQGRQIRYKNAESLVNRSQTLENSGDLYEALAAAAQALPENIGDPVLTGRAVAQAAALTGAYAPEIFTATQKFTFSTDIKDLYLLNGGQSLLVLSEEGSSLWNVRTGEMIRFFAGDRNRIACYHDAAIEGDLSIERYAQGLITISPVGNKGFIGGRYKAAAEETNREEDAIFYINEEEKTIQRISPVDGSVIWTGVGEYAYPSYGMELSRTDGLPVIVSEKETNKSGFSDTKKSICVLDYASGRETARLGFDQLEEQIADYNDFNRNNVFFVGSYFLVLYEGDVYVFQAKEGESVFLYTLSDVVDGSIAYALTRPIKDAFIYDGTLLLLGKERDNVPSAATFFCGYDLADGSRKWALTRKAPVSASEVRNARIGVYQPSRPGEGEGDVVFGVVDSEAFVVDPATGEDLGSFPLVSAAKDMYYAENGNVFVIDCSGREIVFTVNDELSFVSKTLSDVYMVQCHDFRTEIEKASYCNNTYAVVRGSCGNEAVIYTTAGNDNRSVVFQTDEKESLYDAAFNGDCSLMTVRNYSKEEVLVIETGSGTVVSTIPQGEDYVSSVSFFGNGSLAVRYSKKVCFYHALTGELTQTYEFDYDDDVTLLSASGELLVENGGKIAVVKPGEEPETVFDLEEYLLRRFDGEELPYWYCHGCFVSPSGSRFAVAYDCGEAFGEKEKHLLMVDRTTGEGTEAASPDIDYLTDVLDAVWSKNEEELYLLTKKQFVGYHCGSGKTIFDRENDGSGKALAMMNGRLCVLDSAGTLRPTDPSDGEADAASSLLLETNLSSPRLEYLPIDGARGFLRCGTNAWLIDAKSFEIVFRADGFFGYDPSADRIYTTYYDSVCAYPMLSAYALRQRAESILR